MSSSAQGDRLGQWSWWAAALLAILAVTSCRPSEHMTSDASARAAGDAVVPVAGQDSAPAKVSGAAAVAERRAGADEESESPGLGEQAMQSEAEAGQSLVEQYFPLRENASWRYRLRVTDGAGELVAEAMVAKTVRGPQDVDGQQYWRVETETLSGDDPGAPPQHYRVTKAGVVAAVAGVKGKELLIFPSAPESNRSWTDEAPPAIKRLSAKVATDQKVQSGAGSYSSCIYVDLDMAMPGRGLFSPAEVPVRIERWFAPGVGMVRERRTADGRVMDAVLERGEGN